MLTIIYWGHLDIIAKRCIYMLLLVSICWAGKFRANSIMMLVVRLVCWHLELMIIQIPAKSCGRLGWGRIAAQLNLVAHCIRDLVSFGTFGPAICVQDFYSWASNGQG